MYTCKQKTVHNTGNKIHRQWVMTQCPPLVSKYVERGFMWRFDLIKLKVAIDIGDGNEDEIHGAMTAFISYRALFRMKHEPLSIFFTVGNNMFLFILLGSHLPLLLDAKINFATCYLEHPTIDNNKIRYATTKSWLLMKGKWKKKL